MSMNSVSSNRSQAIGAGAVLGLAGMNAYFLPVTKDRFVRTSFNITKELTEDKLELLNESALQISNKKLKTENKMFLAQLGVDETIDAINAKCLELKKSITDPDKVKDLKKSFEDCFKDCKKSEAFMDNVSAKAFNKIRWTNFTWGAVIGFVLGSVFASAAPASAPKMPPQQM